MKCIKSLKTVRGIEDLGVIHNIGQPEIDINLDQQKMALYGVATADANAVVGMAIGGWPHLLCTKALKLLI